MTPFHLLGGTHRRNRIYRYMVWRSGTAADWDCTYADIAHETSVDRHVVERICKNAGWVCRGEIERTSELNARVEIDILIAAPSARRMARA
ncbi:hypothetical protein [Salipiger sp.]|uniref:hypothetical protein n=1 Tax=Salipiger sp. TaxID=2078585 RepID=UPI003A96B1E1